MLSSKIGKNRALQNWLEVVRFGVPHANEVRANSSFLFNRAINVAVLSMVKMVPFKIDRISSSFKIWPPSVRGVPHGTKDPLSR